MKPAPKMLTVLRSLPTVLRVRLDPFSTGSPSKSTKGFSCASTKTLDTLSPPAAGRLWQPPQEFASGAEMRLKLSGAVRRLRGSPVPGQLGAACAVEGVEAGGEDRPPVLKQLFEGEGARFDLGLAYVLLNGRFFADNRRGGLRVCGPGTLDGEGGEG